MNRISLALTSFAILMVLTLALLVTAPVVAQEVGATPAATTTQNRRNDDNDFPWGLLGLLGLGGLAGLRRREHTHEVRTDDRPVGRTSDRL